jgi:biotin transport system substrate-specific component
MHTSPAVERPGQTSGTLSLQTFLRTTSGKIAISVAASLFVAACAHCIVPLPFTPVPLTLGDFAVLLVGLLLGPRMAFAALALYLAEGACGLPVFSPAGPGGLAQLFGFTGGYLLSYPFAAALAGWSVRSLRSMPAYAAAALATLASTIVVIASGAGWLGSLHHLPAPVTLRLAVLPFLPGQLVKIVSAAGIYASLHRARNRFRHS